MLTEKDLNHLRRCVSLAEEALLAGDGPFGSILVDSTGAVLYEDRNRTVTGADVTLHPELSIVRWAQSHLSLTERAASTVYTSGEHCPMCSTAHAFAGLGRIVYASSSVQRAKWFPGQTKIRLLPITDVVPGAIVDGPAPELEEEVKELYLREQKRSKSKSAS